MAYKDLREFLVKLEQEGQLVRIKEEVDPEPSIGAAGRAASTLTNGPAVMFEKVRGYRNPVVTNVHGSWANHALMMGMDKNTPVKQQFLELCRRWDKYPVPAKRVDSSPAQKNVVTKDINLFEVLSAYRINTYDAGFYISKACVVSRDPEDPTNYGKQTLGTTACRSREGQAGYPGAAFPRHRDSSFQSRSFKPEGAVAICLGCDPMTTFMASTPSSTISLSSITSARCMMAYQWKSPRPQRWIWISPPAAKLFSKVISSRAFVSARVRLANFPALIPAPACKPSCKLRQ